MAKGSGGSGSGRGGGGAAGAGGPPGSRRDAAALRRMGYDRIEPTSGGWWRATRTSDGEYVGGKTLAQLRKNAESQQDFLRRSAANPYVPTGYVATRTPSQIQADYARTHRRVRYRYLGSGEGNERYGED